MAYNPGKYKQKIELIEYVEKKNKYGKWELVAQPVRTFWGNVVFHTGKTFMEQKKEETEIFYRVFTRIRKDLKISGKLRFKDMMGNKIETTVEYMRPVNRMEMEVVVKWNTK